MADITRKKTDIACPGCSNNMEEVTTVFVDPFPDEDGLDWTLITQECGPCGIRKKISCDNPNLTGIEILPERSYGSGKER